MCDIYTAECAVCKAPIDMHLEDHATRRDEVRVYCERHAMERAVIASGERTEFIWKDDQGEHRVVVIPLTHNARARWLGNCPNVDAEMRWMHMDGGVVTEGVEE